MMKKLLSKKNTPSIILALVFSYMLFIFEPITMYANNTTDFWFDIWILLKVTIIPFILFAAVAIAAMAIINKFVKPKYAIYVYLAAFAVFTIAYINSNYLAGFLPTLDGTTIEWNSKGGWISSIAVIIVVLAALIVAKIKTKTKQLYRITSYISLAIFAMLSVSLLTTVATKKLTKDNNAVTVSTEKNINKLSSNENFLILMIDATDSKEFGKLISEHPEYQEMLKDFSYYPDTMSGYAFTMESMPFIFSSNWYEKPYDDYATKSYNESPFLNKVYDKGYEMNFYDDSFIWNDDKVFRLDNISKEVQSPRTKNFIKQELKYILFKILPYPIKRFSMIQNLNFQDSIKQSENGIFNWKDETFRHKYLTLQTEMTDDKYFQFLHIEGGHVPFDFDENGNTINPTDDNGTYDRKLLGVLSSIQIYLNRIKEAGAYDNSTIIIMADHGFDTDDKWGTLKRGNPALFIKGKNETHHAMKVSNKQISQVDYVEAFNRLLDGAKSTEIFENIPEEGRIRLYYDYGHGKEETMTEYEQRGKAWTTDELIPTGKEIDRY